MICSFRKFAIEAGFIALWIFVLASSPLLAAGDLKTVEIEALRITVDSEWATRVTPGYWPVRFDITNLGDDRTIEILGQGTRWWNSGESGAAEIHQTLKLKRADRKRFTVSVPIFANNENLSFQIRERGKTLQVFSYSSLESGRSADESSVLVVGDSASPYGTAASSWLRPLPAVGRFGPSGPIPRGGGTVPRLDLMLDVSRLPTDWLGFASLRAVFIGPDQWRALENTQRDALLTWVACGGDLFVVDGDPSTLIPEAKETPGSFSLEAPLRYFLGRIYPVNSAGVSGGGISDVLSITRKTGIDSAFALPANRDPEWLTFVDRGFRLSIPGVGGVPVRSYFAILVVFSVLIGPVNYVVLWRKKRQVLLVLTTPLISILFIALIAGYAILGEGLSIRERSQSFTVLDQSRKQAATRASVSMYAAGMAPRNGLRFPRDMAIFPVGIDGRGSLDRETLDLTELQQFTSGIVRARAPSNFEEISFRPARERLTFNRSGETVTVLNGLGATMSKLFYRYGGKTFTLDKPLRDGEQGTLRSGGDWETAVPAPFRDAEQFRSSADAGAEDVYVAFLENSPFIDMGTKVEERGSQHVILGNAGGPAVSNAILEVDALVREFGGLRAVDQVTFSVDKGQVLGFIGPNGAGKTTTMRILATLDQPQHGDARIDGVSVVEYPEEARRRTGFMPDYAGVYVSTTVSEYLDFFARSYGIRSPYRQRAVDGIISFMGIGDLRDRPVDSLSKGLQQRVALGRAIIHNPQLLILDEPAANLDPRARIEFRTLIRELAADGKTILLSSHILTELAEMCDTVAVIEKGKILANGTVQDIMRGMRRHRTLSLRVASNPSAVERFLHEQPDVLKVRSSSDALRLELDFDGEDEAQAGLLQRLVTAGFPILEFTSHDAGLEDLFMKITKGNVQ